MATSKTSQTIYSESRLRAASEARRNNSNWPSLLISAPPLTTVKHRQAKQLLASMLFKRWTLHRAAICSSHQSRRAARRRTCSTEGPRCMVATRNHQSYRRAAIWTSRVSDRQNWNKILYCQRPKKAGSTTRAWSSRRREDPIARSHSRRSLSHKWAST